MAQGQLTFLQMANRVLMRLGKAQVVSTGFTTASTTGDTWREIVRDSLNDAQSDIYKEHDWSTLQTSGTFTSSVRTYNLATSFSTFGREVDLVDTTNNRMLQPVDAREIDAFDPGLDDAGAPTAYAINYPDLLFDRTPTSVAYRIRYFRRPTALSAAADVSILPEYCDLAMVWWVVWQLQASREDAQDGGEGARGIYQSTLARAIGQDRRRMDQLMVLRPVFSHRTGRSIVSFPSTYPAS